MSNNSMVAVLHALIYIVDNIPYGCSPAEISLSKIPGDEYEDDGYEGVVRTECDGYDIIITAVSKHKSNYIETKFLKGSTQKHCFCIPLFKKFYFDWAYSLRSTLCDHGVK